MHGGPPSMTRLDRPGHRPGAVRYALSRLPALLHPPVSVYEPPAGSLSKLHDVPVVERDGTTLRVNVVLPAGRGRFPVLMSAHPYGKDNLPQRRGQTVRSETPARWATRRAHRAHGWPWRPGRSAARVAVGMTSTQFRV